MLVLDFYDGPTSGILECAGSGACYRFEMLDWDEEQRVRIFRLARLPAGALEECVTVFAPEKPSWPVWFPWARGEASDMDRAKADRKVEEVLSRVEPPSLLVAWTGYGDYVLAARRLPPSAFADAPGWFFSTEEEEAPRKDWFALLGMSRQSLPDLPIHH
jgi:hypothetical protein